jgi:hypothetical protein
METQDLPNLLSRYVPSALVCPRPPSSTRSTPCACPCRPEATEHGRPTESITPDLDSSGAVPAANQRSSEHRDVALKFTRWSPRGRKQSQNWVGHYIAAQVTLTVEEALLRVVLEGTLIIAWKGP